MVESSRWTPHATVAVVIVKDDQFLVVEEYSQNQAVFNQPAGHVEANETLIAAARREAFEETGYHVNINGIVGLYTYTAPSNGITYHRYCFFGTADEFDPTAQLDDGIIGPKWMSIDELRQCPRLRSPMVLTCFEDYLRGQRFPLELIIEHP